MNCLVAQGHCKGRMRGGTMHKLFLIPSCFDVEVTLVMSHLTLVPVRSQGLQGLLPQQGWASAWGAGGATTRITLCIPKWGPCSMWQFVLLSAYFFTIGWVKLKIGTKVQTIEELIWGFLFSSIHLSEGQNYGDLAQLLQACSFLQLVCCWCEQKGLPH